MERGANGQGEKQRREQQRAKPSADQDGQHGVVRGVAGREMRGGNKGAGSGTEERRMHEGAPARRPDVDALVEVTPLQLLGDGRQAFERSTGNDEPEGGEKRRQREDYGRDAAGVTQRQE